jgi:tRNA G37 N-methylase TrmD
VLISGDHDAVRRWREQAAREKTARNRPDLLAREVIDSEKWKVE